MHNSGIFAVSGLVGLSILTGCAPPGYENAAFTRIQWPTTDQAMTIDQRIEIEGRLKALNYLSEPADGVVTRESRQAIRAFQTDIGAPANGIVSVPLLDALQTNTAYLTPEEVGQFNQDARVPARSTRPAATTAVGSKAVAPNPASTGAGGEGGGEGGSGGAGGSGAGAWN